MDTSVTPSYEEQRLPNKLADSDGMSFSQQILTTSGFDKFGPNFATTLCNNGLAGASTYDDAVKLLHTEGEKLWQAALDRVQGRNVQGSLPQSDDRMLYWARLTMTLALRQWKPDFPLSDSQRASLQVELEKASRGQLTIDFPAGTGYKRILISGFDPFELGNVATNGDLGIRNGNPSGAIILALNGNTIALPDGTTAMIQVFILPVDYGPFIDGMQEDALGPWFQPGPKRVDASVSISQAGGEFDLEHYNGRYHFADFPGNDNLNPPCIDSSGNSFPNQLECDINPPARWLGYSPTPWTRDTPPQFTVSTLPFQAMIDANTGNGIVNPETQQTGGWAVVRHDPYVVGPCTKAESDTEAAQASAQAKVTAAGNAWAAAGDPYPSPLYDAYVNAQNAANALPPANPLETNCALQGGGGNYLSNASAYRNTLMRDLFKLTIPAGHIHTPEMTVFGSGSDDKITDATLEAHRNAIVAQARNLIVALAKSLATPAAK